MLRYMPSAAGPVALKRSSAGAKPSGAIMTVLGRSAPRSALISPPQLGQAKPPRKTASGSAFATRLARAPKLVWSGDHDPLPATLRPIFGAALRNATAT